MGNESRFRMVNSVCTSPCRGCLRLTKCQLLVFADCPARAVTDWQSCLIRQTNLLDRKWLSYLCCVLLAVLGEFKRGFLDKGRGGGGGGVKTGPGVYFFLVKTPRLCGRKGKRRGRGESRD